MTQSDGTPSSTPEQEPAAPPPPLPPDSHGAESSLRQIFASIEDAIFELFEYIGYYFAVKLDLAKLAYRQMLLWGALLAMAIIATSAIVVAATVLVCIGIAHGLGELFDSQWLADILTGLGVLAGVAFLGRLAIRRFANLSGYEETTTKYEERRRRQQKRFGRDVSDWENVENDHE